MNHDLTLLKKHWEIEFLKKEFKWLRLIKKLKKRANNYMFWYRLAYFMYRNGDHQQRKVAKKINEILNIKHSVDIPVKAAVGIGFNIWHLVGIVITERAEIGENLQIGSGVVIGYKDYEASGYIRVGDNVTIGTNSVLIGQHLKIGDNVTVGAMSFINKNIQDNCIVYTKKTNEIIQNDKI